MSSFSIESAAKCLGKLLVKEVQYLSQVRDKVEDLQSELEWIQCFLLDADSLQNKNALIRKWVSEISDAAFKGEDLTETYILKVSNKRRDGFLNGLKWLACFWMDAKTLHIVGCEIDGLTSKISKMSSRLQTYGVRSSYVVQSSRTSLTMKLLAEQRRTYPHAQPGDLVGVERDVDKLINQLKEGTQRIVVAHGMGGIGKTALAREVYHKCLSQGHFAGCAWAYVSQQCDLKSVCQELLNELIPKTEKERRLNINNLEVMPKKICEILKRNNYLVVLDDVWKLIDWKCLEPAFPIHDSSCGTKILVTTRNPQIFSNLEDNLVATWEAEILEKHSCWKLLENKGRFKRNALDSSMEEEAEKMLDHCNGHPLAIVALGGVLATKKSLEEWVSVRENLQYHLQGDEESYSGVYDVLALSYYDLHYNLKPCFLHMGHFPEGFCIEVEKLYNLWIADGIVSSTQYQIGKKRSLEDIADNYLNQMVQKGIIQVNNEDVDGRITICGIHDLMRDKCLEMAREENFLQIVNIDDKNQKAFSDPRTERARRLTVYVGKEDGQCVLESLSEKMASLRSLMFISTCAEHSRKKEDCEWVKTICKRFKLLRVLDFEGGVILTGALPKQIGNLLYLRHLCLRGTQVTELPPSIRNLKSLLILDLCVSRVVITLPNVLWEMRSLCCLYFPVPIQVDDYTQGYKTVDGKPLILDKLSHLERVTDLDLDQVDVKGLLELTSMRKLSATIKHKKDSLVPFLKSPSIKYLSLVIDPGLLSGGSDMLLSESSCLRVLLIDGGCGNLPTCIPIRVEMFPSNLVGLGFWHCLLEEDPMPVLEKLPKLKSLQLHVCYQGKAINCSDKAFPELISLELDGLFHLHHLNVQKGGFPKLSQLLIFSCPLERIPDVLPSDVHIVCAEDLQPLVEEFRLQRPT